MNNALQNEFIAIPQQIALLNKSGKKTQALLWLDHLLAAKFD